MLYFLSVHADLGVAIHPFTLRSAPREMSHGIVWFLPSPKRPRDGGDDLRIVVNARLPASSTVKLPPAGSSRYSPSGGWRTIAPAVVLEPPVFALEIHKRLQIDEKF